MSTETEHKHGQVCGNCRKPIGTSGDCLPPTPSAVYDHTFIYLECERCAEVVSLELTRGEVRQLSGSIERAYYMDFNRPESANLLQQKLRALA